MGKGMAITGVVRIRDSGCVIAVAVAGAGAETGTKIEHEADRGPETEPETGTELVVAGPGLGLQTEMIGVAKRSGIGPEAVRSGGAESKPAPAR